MKKIIELLQNNFTEDGEKIICSSLKLRLEDGLDPNISINTQNSYETQPLLIDAIIYGSTKIIQLLISNGADVNIKNWFEPELALGYISRTPLIAAIVKKDTEIVKLLLDNGADVNFERDYYCMTPLMLASYKDNFKVVELLVECGARINDEHSYLYWNALMFTIPNQSHDIRKYLLKNGAKSGLFGLGFQELLYNVGYKKINKYSCWDY